MGHVIAVINQKGGVGKTTTVVNLGAALTAKAYRVMLIDLDPLGNLTGWLSESDSNLMLGAGDLLCGEKSIDNIRQRSGRFGMDFLPSGEKLRNILNKKYIDSYALQQRLISQLDSYHFILIDCPPSSDVLVRNALLASNSIIIPIQTETLPLKSGIRFLQWLEEFKIEFESKLNILGILPCMFDGRTRLSNQILEAMRGSENLGPMLFNTVIRKSARLAETPGAGKSIFETASTSNVANDYISLVWEVIERTRTDFPPMTLGDGNGSKQQITNSVAGE